MFVCRFFISAYNNKKTKNTQLCEPKSFPFLLVVEYMSDLRHKLQIPEQNLKEINNFLLNPDNPLITDLLQVIDKYGGVDEINKKAEEAGQLDNLLTRLQKKQPDYVKDLEWLTKKRDSEAFISLSE